MEGSGSERPPDDAIDALYRCIQTRPRPEDVAQLILEVSPSLLEKERAALHRVAKGSLKQGLAGYSSMAADFARPAGAERQVRKSEVFFVVEAPLSAADCLEPERVDEHLRQIAGQLAYLPGQASFRVDRLNRAARAAAGLTWRKRQYNKRWRFLKRLEAKIARMVRNRRIYQLTRVAKSAAATRLSREEVGRDLPTACFVAYLSARMSLRSTFTNQSQARAFDVVAELLYWAALRSPSADYWVMAHVHPEREVLAGISVEAKGQLLGRWFDLLNDIGGLLDEIGTSTGIDRVSLVVTKGNDSSTWNQAAGAWNKARDHWIALLHSLGMARVLDDLCPGKVLRLMAADVVRWHLKTGGALHPDTKVWAELPPPWEVLKGRARCTRAMVEAACRKHGVSPAGWAGPKPPKQAVAFTPTPELVHGVAVSSPALAQVLRAAQWFSGKLTQAVEGVVVARDADGFALGAAPVDPAAQIGEDEDASS